MDSLSNMDSAGSCDSVISVNSGYSEDSMEHLSAEERACLMYLEETIESLEVQEDSGLSSEEPESVQQAEKMDPVIVNDVSTVKSDESGGDQKADKAEYLALNETSEPQSSPASAAITKDLEPSVTLLTPPQLPATESETHPSASQTKELCLSKDGDGHIHIVSSNSESAKAPEIDLALIPPPLDFMDEPSPPPPETEKVLPPTVEISNHKQGATVDLEQLRQRASMKTTTVAQDLPDKPPELTQLSVNSGPQISLHPETTEPRSPPAVAPKPKKLPANIILKSHKSAVADGSSGHSVPICSDRVLMDPQKVRMEALRKLGLLKSDDAESGPALSPKLSPKTRKSWAAPSPPISPAPPHTPPLTPSHIVVRSPSPASVPLQSPAAPSPSGLSAAPVDLPPDIVPAPAAFSDPDGPLLSDKVKDISGATVNVQATTPPRTPPALGKHLTPPKTKGVKSATLERSGPGLSSYMASQESAEAGQGGSSKHSPSHLRNSRPRPASLGSGKDFSSAQGESSPVVPSASKEPDLRRSLPASQPSGDAQKLPRSQGISVLICPRAEHEEDRREALRRLGLLRD